MKIFFSVNNLYKQVNPYTWTLADGIKSIDSTVEFLDGCKSFWTDDILSCDIVHIHWPEQLLLSHDKYSAKDLETRIAFIKDKGVKIVVTCHNLLPHKGSDDRKACYDIVYRSADVILHLGSFSYDYMKEIYPKADHRLIMHHVYDDVYTQVPTRKDACEMLRLDASKKYILCFGQFRNEEERNLVIAVYKEMKKYGFEIIAPGFSPVAHHRKNIFLLLKTRLQYLKYSVLYSGIHKNYDVVPDKDVPAYYAASDVCFIQRKQILNSGNLPLALYMGNVVVGPDMGNVGPMLRETGNVSFNPQEPSSAIEAIRTALNLPKNQGEKNQEWANSHLRTSEVCQKIWEAYQFVLKDGKDA